MEDRSVHEPVQVGTVLELLSDRVDGTVVDLTVGAGGHAEAILNASERGRLIGLDQDPQILEIARARLAPFGDRVVALRSANFDQIDRVLDELGIETVSGALLDLGVSSLQLDEAERGFSFDHDGPLDMRMSSASERTAQDLVNRGDRDELFHAIRVLGDEPRAGRVVDAILAARDRAPLRRTCELAELVERALGGRPPRGRRHHVATRTFQGLRMAINDELGALERALPRVLDRLDSGGRAVVISFHGGEDRVCKQVFRAAREAGQVRLLTKKPVPASAREIRQNPRARSSRIRGVERMR